MFRFLFLITLMLLSSVLASCGGMRESTVLEGRILLWHAWQGTEAETLNNLIEKFHDIYPGITVISSSYAAADLEQEFRDKSSQGLGPDLLIGEQMWIPALADDLLIQPMDETNIDPERYLTSALTTLRYQGKLYGLPLSVQTWGLYYNKRLVKTEPPHTLDALIEQAEGGVKAAINTNFADAFWGIQAFGGRLMDDNGRVVLNQGGFTNWLDWLVEAQNAPNIIMSSDGETLEQLFRDGEVAYYVGRSTKLHDFQETFGEDNIGVAPLPSGPTDLAGPFLEAEPLLLSNASSPVQTKRALLLIEFLTNIEQQRKLAQQTGRIPANPQVRIDRRVSPAVAGFVEQSKSVAPLLLIPQTFDAIAMGQDAYVQTLEGMLTSVEAANRLTEHVNSKFGFESLPANLLATACPIGGFIEIWHSWSGPDADALAQVGKFYAARCPESRVTFTAYAADELLDRYQEAVRNGEGPDLCLLPANALAPLIDEGLVEDLSHLIEPDFLQRYAPAVPDALRRNTNLYGLPLTIDTMALYYNSMLIEEPPVALGDLLSQLNADRQIAFSYRPFDSAHWGASAFGGKIFNTEGELALNDGGFAEWLEWLQTARDRPGVLLTRSQAEAERLFATGEAAFLVGQRAALRDLQAALGPDAPRVAPLPAGPEGVSGPLLQVDGLVLNPTLEEHEMTAALAFARFTTDVESQDMLMDLAELAPANINVTDVEAHPAVAGFLEQAKTAVISPNRPQMRVIRDLGNTIYEKVLEQNSDPADTLADFTTFIQSVAETSTESPLPTESAQSCTEAGRLLLWHSAQGVDATMLEQIVADFARICPDVQIDIEYVAADELPGRLATASGAMAVQSDDANPALAGERAPDLFLAPHDLVVPLSDERLIKPVTPWVTNASLIPYLPESIRGLTYKESLYGLPYTLNTMALYVNTDLVGEPPASLQDLFTDASPSEPLALNSSFEGAFWGVLAFGRQPVEDKGDAGGIALQLEQTGLVEWLRWLQDASHNPGIIMSANPARLRELFASGNAAYLVAGADELVGLRAELNGETEAESRIVVTPLPAGPDGDASPFLTVEAFLFPATVSEEQTRMALRFAEFATAAESQALVVQNAHLVSANLLAISQADDAEINSFMSQAQAAAPMPARPEAMVLFEKGDRLYERVLEEGVEPAAAVARFVEQVDMAPTPDVVAYAGDAVLACQAGDRLQIWHSLAVGDDAAAGADTGEAGPNPLAAIAEWFSDYCVGVQVELRYVAPDEMTAQLTQAKANDATPDAVLTSGALIAPLAQSDLIRPIMSLVDETVRAQYLAKAIEAVAHENTLYGIPQAIHVAALYYNADLVSNPAVTLDELLADASPDHMVILDDSFEGAYWGLGAFGAELLPPGEGAAAQPEGYAEWLAWLHAAHGKPGVFFSADPAEQMALFAAGQAAYLVAGPELLAGLRAALDGRVRVAPLPAGPRGKAAPLLQVDAFLFPTGKTEAQTQLALAFAEFATSEVNQTRWLQTDGLAPTNRTTAELTQNSAVRAFVTQAVETAIVLPSARLSPLHKLGDQIYAQVLDGELSPEAGVNMIFDALRGAGHEGGSDNAASTDNSDS